MSADPVSAFGIPLKHLKMIYVEYHTNTIVKYDISMKFMIRRLVVLSFSSSRITALSTWEF